MIFKKLHGMALSQNKRERERDPPPEHSIGSA